MAVDSRMREKLYTICGSTASQCIALHEERLARRSMTSTTYLKWVPEAPSSFENGDNDWCSK